MNKSKSLFKLAIEFNVSTRTIHTFLVKNGISLPHKPNSKISPELYDYLLDNIDQIKFRQPKKKKRKSKRNKKHRVSEHNLIINGYPVDIFTTYYPKNRFKNVSNKAIQERELIYSLKKGILEQSHVRILSGIMARHFEDSFENVLLCCIPASTNSLTQLRFRQLLIDVCNKKKILNGYGAIRRFKDRKSMQEVGHEINRIEGIKFNKKTFEERDVVLFDDILTTGKSFTEFSNEISSFNVRSIYGVMFGKTNQGNRYNKRKNL
jgi:ATP-dependent DNA helicase RecQ